MKLNRRTIALLVAAATTLLTGAVLASSATAITSSLIYGRPASQPDQYITDLPSFTSGWVTIVHVGYVTDTCVPICRVDTTSYGPVNAWKYTYNPNSPWQFSPIPHNTRVWASVMPGTQRVWSWVWYNNTWYAARSDRLLVNKAYYSCTTMCPIR